MKPTPPHALSLVHLESPCPRAEKPTSPAPAPASPTGVVTEAVQPIDARAQSGDFLTTAQGLRLPDTDHSLKAGERGPTLLEDFHLREKITHFDHERIPERVVHARGAAAHGVFESYGTAASVTKAGFLAKGADRGLRSFLHRARARADRPTPCATPAGSR